MYRADISNSAVFIMRRFQSMLADETNTGISNLVTDLFGFNVMKSLECKCS